MAILKIARLGRPCLRQAALPVEDLLNPEVRRLAGDMIATMLDAPGTGLAAPQVHQNLRIIVYRVLPERASGREGDVSIPETVLINPVIEPEGSVRVLGWEGCLSLPGIRGEVIRWDRIRCRGFDLDGREVERLATGAHARVLQHEVDHLDGILFVDRMADLKRLSYVEELPFLLGQGNG